MTKSIKLKYIRGMNLISNSIVKSLLDIGNKENDIEDILSWVKLIRKKNLN